MGNLYAFFWRPVIFDQELHKCNKAISKKKKEKNCSEVEPSVQSQ